MDANETSNEMFVGFQLARSPADGGRWEERKAASVPVKIQSLLWPIMYRDNPIVGQLLQFLDVLYVFNKSFFKSLICLWEQLLEWFEPDNSAKGRVKIMPGGMSASGSQSNAYTDNENIVFPSTL